MRSSSPTGARKKIRSAATAERDPARKALKKALRDARQRLELAARGSQAGIWDWNPVTGEYYHSPRLDELLGYGEGKVPFTRESFIEAVHPEDRDRVLAQTKGHFSARSPYDVEFRLRCRDGGYRWFRSRGQALWDDKGKALRFAGSVIDVHQYKTAESALRESQERFRDLSELSSDWYWEQDENLRFSKLSDDARSRGAFDESQVLGRRRRELPLLEVAPEQWQEHERALAAREPFHDFQYAVEVAPGNIRWHTISGKPIFDKDGRFRGYRGVGRDITLRKRTMDALREAEHRYRSLVELSPDAICITSNDTIEYANQAALKLFGANDAALLVGRQAEALVHPLDRTAAGEYRKRLEPEQGNAPIAELRLRRLDGSEFHGELSSVSLRLAGRVIVQITIRDVTERRRAEERVRALMQEEEAILENALVGIALLKNRVIVRCNNAFARMLGYDPAELPGASTRVVHISEEAYEQRGREAYPVIAEGGTFTADAELRRKDGSHLWVNYRLSAVARVDLSSGVVWVVQDISEQKRAEEQLIQLAHYDAVTGLPNRRLFRDRLQQALAQASRNEWQVGVLYVDLDRFKWVNDTLGHKAGDLLLEAVSDRLKECLRAEDTVARLGGDEFAAILPDMGDSEYAGTVARRIIDKLGRQFTISGQEVYISASIGITVSPTDGGDSETVLRNADAAMYRVKEQGRANFQFFSPAMNERALHFLEVQSKLRGALTRGEFLLHYQPRAEIATRRVVGVEALLRWQPLGRELVAPGDFVPLLEETGLIVPVGEWVLETACAQLKSWSDRGIGPLVVSVNVSPRQFRRAEIVAAVRRVIAQTGVDPRLLELEITEGLLMVDTEATIQTLRELTQIGVRIAIDDFGTGYSSLSHLKKSKIDCVKIDRTFIRDITTDANDAAIAMAIIAMAHKLGLKVIAEGVEAEAQRDFLEAYGCDEYQGYLLCRPAPAAELESLLSRGEGTRSAEHGT